MAAEVSSRVCAVITKVVGLKLKVSRNVDNPVDKEGTLYLLEIGIDGKMVTKIGVTGRKIEDRVVEITASCFKKYRYFPYVKPKRFRVVEEVYKKEAVLLQYFKPWKYESMNKFGGCQELIDLPVDEIVPVYEELLLQGELSEDTKSEGRKAFEDARVKAVDGAVRGARRDDIAEVGVFTERVGDETAGEAENKEAD
jgi:hypothetical protein